MALRSESSLEDGTGDPPHEGLQAYASAVNIGAEPAFIVAFLCSVFAKGCDSIGGSGSFWAPMWAFFGMYAAFVSLLLFWRRSRPLVAVIAVAYAMWAAFLLSNS